MKISKIEFKNINSYGNALQEIEFDTEKGSIILVNGLNGHGKCLSSDTTIDIDVENDEIRQKLIDFLKNK